MIPTFEEFLYPFLLMLKDGEISSKDMKQTKGTVLLVCGLCGMLEIRHATALTTGAKHWHR